MEYAIYKKHFRIFAIENNNTKNKPSDMDIIIDIMENKEKKRFSLSKSVGALKGTRVITDTKTGVQYLFVYEGYSGGLTLLVDKEGKPLIDKNKEYEK